MDRNDICYTTSTRPSMSLSARRAWIEILASRLTDMSDAVALRKESVDRNLYYGDDLTFSDGSLSARRAWIEIVAWLDYSEKLLSLSARRAWIEMTNPKNRKWRSESLSARRAWIEIMDDLEPSTTRRVALRKESVDRNPVC